MKGVQVPEKEMADGADIQATMKTKSAGKKKINGFLLEPYDKV